MEYRYMLEGHAIMWVPEEAHRAIVRTGAAFPLAVEITKHRNGWEVVHLVDEPAAANGYGQASPTSARPAQPQPAARPARGPLDTAQQQLPHTPGEQPYSASMYTALCAAIRTAAGAEKFAQEIGRPVAFDTADIRAIAATLFIHATEGSR
jgi:hypothetical protein